MGQTPEPLRVHPCKQEVMISMNLVVFFLLLNCYDLLINTFYIKIVLIYVKEHLYQRLQSCTYYFNHDSSVIEPNIKKQKRTHTMMKKDVRNMMIQAMS